MGRAISRIGRIGSVGRRCASNGSRLAEWYATPQGIHEGSGETRLPGGVRGWPRPESYSPRLDQGFEARDHVEKLRIDPALAQLVEAAVEAFEQLLDVLFRPLHGREATRVLAGK